jgi:hypothetical protein
MPDSAGGALRKLRGFADANPNNLALREFSADSLDIDRYRGWGTAARWHEGDPATGGRQWG